MSLALYVAFWLQLESAATAATCVGILSLPTRGQVLQKAAYRIAGTAVGLVASFVIAGLFNEIRDLLLIASGAWISLCVLVAGSLDGNRAYAAVLSGYTVAIVTVVNIDAPQDVFASGANRGAAIAVGICAVALASALVFTPDILPKLLGKFQSAHSTVRAAIADALRTGDSDPVKIARLFKEITTLRPDSTLLPLERLTGNVRAAAARNASASMIREIAAGRYVAATLASIGAPGQAVRDDLTDLVQDAPSQSGARLLRRIEAAFATPRSDARRLIAASAGLVLLERDRTARAALQDMRNGGGVTEGARLPIWRSRENAVRNAIRNFLAFGVTAGFFVVFSDWPATSSALDAFGAVIGVSATNASPPTVALGAVIAVPLAALAAGLTEFVLLDGADQFPILVLAMAPTLVGASLIALSGKPKLAPIGTLTLVLYPLLLSPSNPQNYDAGTFLSNSVLVILAIIMVYVCLTTILPTNDKLRRRWILRSAWNEFRDAINGKFDRNSPAAAAYRDADRIAQLGALTGESMQAHRDSVRFALRLSDIASCSRRIHALHADAPVILPQEAAELRLALAALDPIRLVDIARGVLARSKSDSREPSSMSRQLAAEMMLAAALIERYQSESDAFRSQNHLSHHGGSRLGAMRREPRTDLPLGHR